MKQRHISIAIDGPGCAGKTTLARLTAQKLGFIYVDTEAIARAAVLRVLNTDTDPADNEAVSALIPDTEIELTYAPDGTQHTYLNGKDVTTALEKAEVTMVLPHVTAQPDVRVFLLETQRYLARTRNAVLDGYDIGTIVLPEADIKIFLTAKLKKRAWRRALELDGQGRTRPYAEILNELRTREKGGLSVLFTRKAPDAVELDTTHMTVSESVEALGRIIREKTGVGAPPAAEPPHPEYAPLFHSRTAYAKPEASGGPETYAKPGVSGAYAKPEASGGPARSVTTDGGNLS